MIKIDFDIDKNVKYDFDIEKLAKRVAKAVFSFKKIVYDVSFNLSIVSTSTIKKINNIERGINTATDVLSFPNIDFDKPCNFKPYIGKNAIDVSIVDLNTHTIFLGDVLICKSIMEKQAKNYMHSIKREFAFLLTHSLLHLLGYDHIEKSDETKMFKMQDSILNELKIYR